MQLKVIGSNSAGNGYLLVSATDTLLIECGVSLKKIKQALNFKVSNVNAIVSHSHGDHANYLKQVLDCGIPVYASNHTLNAKGLAAHHRVKEISAGNQYQIGSFTVMPFPVHHDVPCFGYMIYHPEMGITVFLTDSYYSDFVFPAAQHFIVECNHSQDIMEQNDTKKFLKDRIMASHMNLETCKTLLKSNDLRSVINVVLIHLSDTNSDSRRFKREVEQETGKTVFIAEPGLTIPFNKTAF